MLNLSSMEMDGDDGGSEGFTEQNPLFDDFVTIEDYAYAITKNNNSSIVDEVSKNKKKTR